MAMEKSREKVEVGATGQRAGRAMRSTHSVHNKSLRAVAKCEYNSECASSLRHFAACRARYLENTVGKSLSLPCHIASVELSPSSSHLSVVLLSCPLSICELFHISTHAHQAWAKCHLQPFRLLVGPHSSIHEQAIQVPCNQLECGGPHTCTLCLSSAAALATNCALSVWSDSNSDDFDYEMICICGPGEAKHTHTHGPSVHHPAPAKK